MDPDGDGLTNNLNTWISDGHLRRRRLHQASAYLYRLNRAAEIAARLGDGQPLPQEAERSRRRAGIIWMPRHGVFASIRIPTEPCTAAEAPSVYHPVEFGLADPLQALRATDYLTRRLWRYGDQIWRTTGSRSSSPTAAWRATKR